MADEGNPQPDATASSLIELEGSRRGVAEALEITESAPVNGSTAILTAESEAVATDAPEKGTRFDSYPNP